MRAGGPAVNRVRTFLMDSQLSVRKKRSDARRPTRVGYYANGLHGLVCGEEVLFYYLTTTCSRLRCLFALMQRATPVEEVKHNNSGKAQQASLELFRSE